MYLGAGHADAALSFDPHRQQIEIMNVGQGVYKGNSFNVREATSWKVIPGYKHEDFTHPDMLVGVVNAPFDNVPEHTADSFTFSRPAEGEMLELAGYGRHQVANPTTWEAEDRGRDGKGRAFLGPVEAEVVSKTGASSEYYIGVKHRYNIDPEGRGGNATPGDSGGPVYTVSGNLVGLMIASREGYQGYNENHEGGYY